MSHIASINMMLGKDSSNLGAITIPVAANLGFLKELARRALGLEMARKNAKAICIMADDYADHELVFGGPVQTNLHIHKVAIDCSSGYYTTPYLVLQTKDGTNVFGRLSTIELAAIQDIPMPETAAQLEAA